MKTAPLDRKPHFNRRQFLRGLGACVALPAFASLAPTGLIAASATDRLATTASGAPLRTAFLYFPNGALQDPWWPKETGTDFEFSPTLQPLAPLRRQLQVLGQLDDRSAAPVNDGAGDHARASGTFLTSVRLKKSATDLHAGVSIDQIMARAVGAQTRFPSLELTCDAPRLAGACDSGYSCAYQYNLSWNSPSTPLTAETNPRQVFERLFGAGSPGERLQNLKRRQQEQRSILDFVLDSARQMQRGMNSRDRDKLDQYLTGVRDIETRIARTEKLGLARDPMIQGPPAAIENFKEHMDLMFDILTLAFQTDSTRVATLMLAHDGSNQSFSDIDVPEGHHDLSHHFGDAEKMRKIAIIDHWYVTQLAKFLQKLDQVKDADGQSILHNSMILFGSGCADGNRHTHVNLPLVLAGAGGGTLTPGRYVRHNSVSVANLFLSMCDRMGMDNLPRFGDSTGRLSNL